MFNTKKAGVDPRMKRVCPKKRKGFALKKKRVCPEKEKGLLRKTKATLNSFCLIYED
jgi:hypothetical protein